MTGVTREARSAGPREASNATDVKIKATEAFVDGVSQADIIEEALHEPSQDQCGANANQDTGNGLQGFG
jgi:hypothetical protein